MHRKVKAVAVGVKAVAFFAALVGISAAAKLAVHAYRRRRAEKDEYMGPKWVKEFEARRWVR